MYRPATLFSGLVLLLLLGRLSFVGVVPSSWQPVPLKQAAGTHHKPVQRLKAQPRVQSRPLHLLLCSDRKLLKVYNSPGYLIYRCAATNEAVNVGFWHYGSCPRGTFSLGRTVRAGTAPFGRWFVPLRDLTPDGPMHRYHRTGIGLHAGGSKLANPFAEYQRLLKTHGCVRVSNHDLEILVHLLHSDRAHGRTPLITIQ